MIAPRLTVRSCRGTGPLVDAVLVALSLSVDVAAGCGRRTTGGGGVGAVCVCVGVVTTGGVVVVATLEDDVGCVLAEVVAFVCGVVLLACWVLLGEVLVLDPVATVG